MLIRYVLYIMIIYSFTNRKSQVIYIPTVLDNMHNMKISDFRNARIIDTARHGATISGIAKETKIPFASVYRAIRAFENIGLIKTDKIGKKVIVRVTKPNHPFIKSKSEVAKWISDIIWNPDIRIAQIFVKNKIDYAFIGTTKIKYTRQESRNMVQIAVREEHFQQAREIIDSYFKEIGIKTTESARETIGNAMSIIYVKCFPVKIIKYSNYDAKVGNTKETVKVRIADDETEKQAMNYATDEDIVFIPTMIHGNK
jgi:sugar-specific transcriptional regulator TrmB